MKRKGNGWVAEELEITEEAMTKREIGDWDMRSVTEQKIMNAIVGSSIKENT